jgi:hypothetical protein
MGIAAGDRRAKGRDGDDCASAMAPPVFRLVWRYIAAFVYKPRQNRYAIGANL